jgi:hypothetical protein
MRGLFICLIPVLIITAGCDGRQVRDAKAYGMMDRAPQTTDKGYVEFYAHKNEAPVPIFQMDAKGRRHAVGAVGLNKGEPYSKTRYEMDVTERLRVAVPPGTQTFMFERDGKQLKVPVVAGQVTPVEVYYTRLQRGQLFDFYTIDMDVLPSRPATEMPAPPVKK